MRFLMCILLHILSVIKTQTFTIIHILFDPFINFECMYRAMIVCSSLSISVTLIGCFLMLKRMSLWGDVLSHALLPGVAIGYFFSGISFIVMGIGGFISGLVVVILSNWISEKTLLQHDAGISGLHLGFLALGIILMSLNGSNIDLLNLLFGSVLSVSVDSFRYIALISFITFISIMLFYRILIVEMFDSDFLRRSNFILSKFIKYFFLLVLVLNLIASCQVTGTLMSVGLMMLPGLSARCWAKSLMGILLLSVCIALLCSWFGLLGSFYMTCPAGPSIILCASIFFLISVFFGKNQGILSFIYYKKCK